MFAAFREFAQSFLGRGEATITVPSFDGALKPNQALERAECLFVSEAPEDLATDGRDVYLADGPRLAKLVEGRPQIVREFEAPITALTLTPAGALAAALGGKEVRVYANPAAAEPVALFSNGLRAVNALSPAGPDAFHGTEGSNAHDVGDWVWDLMERGRSGRLLRFDVKTGSVSAVAQGLRYAYGVAAMGDNALVSESWRHRLSVISPNGSRRDALTRLPVYPSRLAPASGGGWWLTAFIARTLLVEFVLREPAYRKRMMAEINPEHWIAPRLASDQSFMEPMQGAHLKTMGVVKPWAPPRSYGLVVRLDAEAKPLYSLHSRFDGINHGIVSAAEANGALYLIARGPRRVLRLPIEGLAREYSA